MVKVATLRYSLNLVSFLRVICGLVTFSATVSRPTSAAADAKRNSIANAVTNRNNSANLTGQSPAVHSADAPKQAASDTSRQIRRRQGSTSRPMSQEEKLELAGRNAASAMGGGDRTSRACSIL